MKDDDKKILRKRMLAFEDIFSSNWKIDNPDTLKALHRVVAVKTRLLAEYGQDDLAQVVNEVYREITQIQLRRTEYVAMDKLKDSRLSRKAVAKRTDKKAVRERSRKVRRKIRQVCYGLHH